MIELEIKTIKDRISKLNGEAIKEEQTRKNYANAILQLQASINEKIGGIKQLTYLIEGIEE